MTGGIFFNLIKLGRDLALVPIDAQDEDEPRAMERTSTSTSGNGFARRRGKYCWVPHCTNGFTRVKGGQRKFHLLNLQMTRTKSFG